MFNVIAGQSKHVVVPAMDPAKQLVTRTPPNSSLIDLSPADDGGIAMVTGAVGSTVGAWVEIRHDPSSRSYGESRGAGTIIRVPVPVAESGTLATMREAFEWCGHKEGDGPINDFGIVLETVSNNVFFQKRPKALGSETG